MVKEIPVSFRNCRNITLIENDSLPIQANRLNILFGRNGTGKTTISRVIECWNASERENEVADLASFDHMLSKNPLTAPSVDMPASNLKAFTFNDEWIANHCFHEDGNLQSGAYELYISSDSVKRLEKQRDKLLQSLASALYNDRALATHSLLTNASKGIGVTSRGSVSRAFKENAPFEGLPNYLISLVESFKNDQKPLWMTWHIQGKAYAENKRSLCPYCGNRTERISDLVSYDELHGEAQGSAWGKALSVFAEGRVFRITINRKALRIMSGAHALEKEELDWLSSQAQRAKALAVCINDLKDEIHSFHDGTCDGFFKKMRERKETLEDMKGFSDEIREVSKAIVKEIRRLLDNEEKMRNVVSKLEREAAATAGKYKEEIDEMLDKCGYPYMIEIMNDCHQKSSKVLLVPKSTGRALSEHAPLSYGEQNTLALILFMFEAMAKPHSYVIVLDDPISSLDGDKRYALLYRMFHKFDTTQPGLTPKDSLYTRTVILLTHDYLVVSDAMTILRNKVTKLQSLYLTCDENGVLHHKRITRDDIKPYIQMIRKRIIEQDGRNSFFKLVYVRCYCEMMRKKRGDKRTKEGCAFDVISLLVDGYTREDIFRNYDWDCKSEPPYIIRTGSALIRNHIPDFCFATMLEELNNNENIITLYEDPQITPFEKLQVLRLLIRQQKLDEQSPILVKYANEVYHLAGDYLLQLDPVDFNPVPCSVEKWCDVMFDEFRNGL